MATGEIKGSQQAVAVAMAESGGPPPDGEFEQIDLIAALGLEKTPKVVELQEAASRRHGGRQAGTRNRRTLEWANYLLSKYTSPLEVLAQIGATPTAELAAALGCTKTEALQERRLAAIALAPYVHQKQAIAVDVTNNKIVNLTITIEGGPGGRPGDDAEVIDLFAPGASPPQEESSGG